MLHFVHRYTREVKVTSATNNYILSNIANVTNYPLNLYLLINNPIVSHYTDLPAFNVGSSFSEGAWIYIDNNSSIIGKSGNNGIGGEGGNTGANGSNGTDGSNGGLAFTTISLANVKILVDNLNGVIEGGAGGLGGGGGGGGGGNVTIGTTELCGGSGGGGAGIAAGNAGVSANISASNGYVGSNIFGGPGGIGAKTTIGGIIYKAGGGGKGGNIGQNGQAGANNGGLGGNTGLAGSRGYAITGNSYITIVSLGNTIGQIGS